MNHQFKPGDLALIVGAHRFPENIGAVVELVAYLPAGQQYTSPDGEIITSPGDCWEITGESICGGYIDLWSGFVVRTPKRGLVDPEHLIPLRGDFAPEQHKAKEAA